MAIDYSKHKRESRYLKLPNVGQAPIEIEIKEIKEVHDADYKFNFIKKTKEMTSSGREVEVTENAGWRIQITTPEGKELNVGNWSVWYAMQKAGVNDGDTVKISHPVKGEWLVEVLKRGPLQAMDV